MLKFGGLIVLSLILYLLKTKTEKYLDKLDDEKQPGFHDLLYILPISILTFIVSMFIFYIYTTDDKQIVEALEVIKYYTIK
ncbi:MAG: hypothetical protein H6779_00875 [Candidatus Nomurabacteria bacterium]|nr:MAG: hypothetical protein H6779_00875 [Candidatus Nomurabacteria bacterium]